jgi:hypothetical protein
MEKRWSLRDDATMKLLNLQSKHSIVVMSDLIFKLVWNRKWMIGE